MIHAALIILVAAACTLVTRAAPFLLFRDRELPGAVVYLGKILPAAIMATLMVYCLRSTGFAAAADFAPQLIAVAVVAALAIERIHRAILVNFGLMICALPINRGLLKMHLAGPVIRITGLVVATVAIQMILSGLGEWVLTLQSGQLPVR